MWEEADGTITSWIQIVGMPSAGHQMVGGDHHGRFAPREWLPTIKLPRVTHHCDRTTDYKYSTTELEVYVLKDGFYHWDRNEPYVAGWSKANEEAA